MSKYRGQSNKNGVNVPFGSLTNNKTPDHFFPKSDSENNMIIYCRTSGTKEKNELSLDVQEQRGIILSKKLGLKPLVIKEKGSGIKSYDDTRPLFTEMIDNITENNISNVWVDDKTRLTRNDSDEQFVHMLMKQNDVNLYYGLDSTPKKWDWITDLVDTIITKVNLNQIKTQVRKSNRSKRRLFQQGLYMKGDSPFGYQLVDRKLEIHPENSEWVKKIFNWYNEGKTNYWIREQLFQGGIQPPRSNRPWFPFQTIFMILQNQNYIGIDTYGDLVNECPKIIDKKLFKSVQKKFNFRKGSGGLKREYLLRGILECVDGNPMGVQGKNKTHKYDLYQCGQKVNKYKKRVYNPCDNCPKFRNLKQDVLDDFVWNTMIQVLEESHIIKQKVKDQFLGNKIHQTKRTLTNKIKKVQKELRRFENRQNDLDTQYYSGKMTKQRYSKLSELVEIEYDIVKEKLLTLKVERESSGKKNEWIDWLDIHQERVKDLTTINEVTKRREIIQMYIKSVRVVEYEPETKRHTLNIEFKLPLFQDGFEWEKNKDGSFKTSKNGTRKFKIQDGKNEKNNLKIYQYLFDSVNLDTGRFQNPVLLVNYIVKSNKFVPSMYHYTNISDRQILHNRIIELKNQNLGYRKIHKILKQEKFKVGNSPTCIDTMIKKIQKRNNYFNQKPIIESEYQFRFSSI